VSVSGQYQYLRDAAGTNIFATKKPQNGSQRHGSAECSHLSGRRRGRGQCGGAVDLRRQSDLAVVTAETQTCGQDLDDAWKAYVIAQNRH